MTNRFVDAFLSHLIHPRRISVAMASALLALCACGRSSITPKPEYAPVEENTGAAPEKLPLAGCLTKGGSTLVSVSDQRVRFHRAGVLLAEHDAVAAERSWVENVHTEGVHVRGRFALTSVQAYGGDKVAYVLTLFDASGTQRWSRTLTSYPSMPTLAPDGHVLYAADGDTHVLSPAGTESRVRGAYPIAGLDADGWFPAQVEGGTPSAPAYAWFNARTSERRPFSRTVVSYDLHAGTPGRWVEGRFIYAAIEGGAVVLVSETPHEARVTPLLPDTGGGAQIVASNDVGTMMFSTDWGETALAVVDVLTGEVTPFLRTPPAGWSLRAAHWGLDFSVDDAGAILASMRDDDEVGMFRTTDAGRTWTLVGSTIELNPDIFRQGMTAISRAGTTGVIRWTDFGYASLYESAQVVRPGAPSADVQTLVNTWTPTPGYPLDVRADGLCVATWAQVGEGRTLQLIEPRSATTTDLVVAGTPSPSWGSIALVRWMDRAD